MWAGKAGSYGILRKICPKCRKWLFVGPKINIFELLTKFFYYIFSETVSDDSHCFGMLKTLGSKWGKWGIFGPKTNIFKLSKSV